jgi:hypothetical protein
MRNSAAIDFFPEEFPFCGARSFDRARVSLHIQPYIRRRSLLNFALIAIGLNTGATSAAIIVDQIRRRES